MCNLTAHAPVLRGILGVLGVLGVPGGPVTSRLMRSVLQSCSPGPGAWGSSQTGSPSPPSSGHFEPASSEYIQSPNPFPPESLWDVYNYGLFQPAGEGRDAKFLEEERTLRDYPQSFEKGVPYLEFRYKTRVYKQTNLDEKILTKLSTKASLKKFLEYIQTGAVEKISKVLEKGLDSNYQDPDTGGTAACQNGLAQHLEHLLFYGADTSSQNASGNTALHVCALYNKENCVRVLLYRGANKEAKNKHGQTPFQVAVMSGNFELGEIIKNHRDSDVVPFLESPKYVPRRKESARTLPPPLLNSSHPLLNSSHPLLNSSHPLLRANSDTVTQAEPLGAPGRAANTNPRQ
ncbi:hypothetical protein CRUP_017158, partial [Coryphaenoides rupestris]